MKIKDGFILRDIAGTTYVVAVGARSKSFKGMVTLNETGKFIWQILEKGATKDDIVEGILAEFEGVDRSTIENDVTTFISKLERDNILE
jgi:hypothetical protein